MAEPIVAKEVSHFDSPRILAKLMSLILCFSRKISDGRRHLAARPNAADRPQKLAIKSL